MQVQGLPLKKSKRQQTEQMRPSNQKCETPYFRRMLIVNK